MKKCLFSLCFGVFLTLISGCGNDILISGKVTFEDDASPIEHGTIHFQSENAVYTGTIKNGTYKTGGVKAVQAIPPNTYKIWFSNVAHIELNNPGTADDDVVTPLLAEEYGSVKTTPVAFEVKRGGPKTFDIQLKRYVPKKQKK